MLHSPFKGSLTIAINDVHINAGRCQQKAQALGFASYCGPDDSGVSLSVGEVDINAGSRQQHSHAFSVAIKAAIRERSEAIFCHVVHVSPGGNEQLNHLIVIIVRGGAKLSVIVIRGDTLLLQLSCSVRITGRSGGGGGTHLGFTATSLISGDTACSAQQFRTLLMVISLSPFIGGSAITINEVHIDAGHCQ